MRYLVLILISLNAWGINVPKYFHFSTQMGQWKVVFQCNEKECQAFRYNEVILLGKSTMKLKTVDAIKKNLISNFVAINKTKTVCPGQEIIIKVFRNYNEKQYFRCFDNNDYYAKEFQVNFTTVFKRIPATNY